MNERPLDIASLTAGQRVSLLAIVEHVYGTPAQNVAHHTVQLRLPDGQRLETNVRNLAEITAGPRATPPPVAPPAAPSSLPAHALAAIAAAHETEASAIAADMDATGRGGRRR